MPEPRGIEERIDWFLSHDPSGPGMCAQHTWHALGGDQGNPPAWGCADANECVDKVKASGRYWTPASGPVPPRGAWVGYKYGSNGHACLSLGDGRIATTDPGNGQPVGIEDLDYPNRWGASGWDVWSDQYAGVRFDVGGEENVWSDYSGKPSGTLTITNAQDYEPLDFATADPPTSGLELHLLYVNCEITWTADPTMGVIRVKYHRDDGDDTAYQDYAVPAGEAIGNPDAFLITATHWESGEKGLGGRWHLRCEGDIASVKLGTRYAKIAVIG